MRDEALAEARDRAAQQQTVLDASTVASSLLKMTYLELLLNSPTAIKKDLSSTIQIIVGPIFVALEDKELTFHPHRTTVDIHIVQFEPTHRKRCTLLCGLLGLASQL